MFQKICSFENLLSAFYLARRGNRYKSMAMEFDFNLESNLSKLSWELSNNIYEPMPYKYFVVHDPKSRNIAAPHFRDRVAQHSLVSVIEPVFDKQFIYDSYACRKDKGTHFGLKRLKKFLQAARTFYSQVNVIPSETKWNRGIPFLRNRKGIPRQARDDEVDDTEIYILQCDVQKYFQNVSWDFLLKIIGKTITCPKTMNLVRTIMTTHKTYGYRFQVKHFDKLSALPGMTEEKSVQERKGIPIGNLTSQLFANIYLNELDHFVKEELRQKWYGRYMDDFFVISGNLEELKKTKEKIRIFLKEKLDLDLHPKKVSISNVKAGVAFVGYRVFYDHILIRGKTLLRMQKKLKIRRRQLKEGKIKPEKLNQTINSFKGHLKHANSWNLSKRMFGK